MSRTVLAAWLKIIGPGALAASTAACSANPVAIEIEGVVSWNQIGGGVLGAVQPGETAVISFFVDPDDYVDSSNTPTRGYSIDLKSFRLSFGGETSIGLAPRFTGPAYFVLRDDDPAVDGFFLSVGTDVPVPLDLDQEGRFGAPAIRFNAGYTGQTLSSLDILDAGGTYDYTGLEVFGMGVADGRIENALGMDFVSMTIAVPEEPGRRRRAGS